MKDTCLIYVKGQHNNFEYMWKNKNDTYRGLKVLYDVS